jgi:simple sugar transport system permease protein
MIEVKRIGHGFKKLFGHVSVPTLIIGGFWIVVLITGVSQGFTLGGMLGETLGRFGRWGLLVLCMVPTIQAGMGPNFSLPIGICCGLLGIVCAIEFGLTGFSWLIVAVLLAVVFGVIAGYLYGMLMNAVKGSEMVIATYMGFAVTFLFCVIWMAAPFTSPVMGWMMGAGLRSQIALSAVDSAQILDNILRFEILGINVPTGMLLVVIACCLLLWLFFRSKTGIAISAVGMNPMFARASGLNVDRSRIIANIISTVLGALGIILYTQSFGFADLYVFPLFLAFQAVASVLVGGATAQRARIFHVILGTIIFQGLLTNSLPVLSRLIPVAALAVPMQLIVQNGIILFALTRVKGGAK